MIESKTKDIDGLAYTVTQLGANQGRKVFTRLAKMFGAAAEAKEPIAGFLNAMSDADVDFLCDAFSKNTTVQLEVGKNPQLSSIFDIHFAGKYAEMLLWLAFCLEVNFGSLFQKVGLKTENIGKILAANGLTLDQNAPGQSGV